MSSLQFTTESADAGNRLDKFLTAKLAGFTRSQIQKLIKAGQATVNGKSVAVHHFLKTGDVVTATAPVAADIPTAKAPRSAPNDLVPTIIYEDAEILVLEKPAGLLVHPTAQNETDTLTAWLLQRYPNFQEVGPDSERPGIVHRLDRDVSGLMVVAKPPAAMAGSSCLVR